MKIKKNKFLQKLMIIYQMMIKKNNNYQLINNIIITWILKTLKMIKYIFKIKLKTNKKNLKIKKNNLIMNKIINNKFQIPIFLYQLKIKKNKYIQKLMKIYKIIWILILKIK